MSDDSLTTPKRKDGFEHESPIRAFTDFKVAGTVAIGKGFRPSLSHLASYLDAMERKEGWAFVQIILPTDDATDPTILFRRDELQADIAESFSADEREMVREIMRPGGRPTFVPVETSTPKHYSGRACADIGERLSGNAFAILRYSWRVGQKDDPCVEMDKALWYCDSELDLLDHLTFKPLVAGLTDPEGFLEDRICDESDFTKNIARMLWHGYDRRLFQRVKEAIGEHRFHLDCGRGLAI